MAASQDRVYRCCGVSLRGALFSAQNMFAANSSNASAHKKRGCNRSGAYTHSTNTVHKLPNLREILVGTEPGKAVINVQRVIQ